MARALLSRAAMTRTISTIRDLSTGLCSAALALLAAGCLEENDLGAAAAHLEGEAAPPPTHYGATLIRYDTHHPELCAAIGGGSQEHGARAIQWPCQPGQEQRWNLEQYAGFWQIKNQNSLLCLGVRGGSTARGADVIQWECEGHRDQWWYWRRLEGGRVQFKNVNSGYCLSVAGGSTARGTRLIQWDCEPVRPGQSWECVTRDGFQCEDRPPG